MSELKREIAAWKDYELLDSGDFEKCERWGEVVIIRPEPQALWPKSNEKVWASAHATYTRTRDEGEWERLKDCPDSWIIGWEKLKFEIAPTAFKHTGLFPEQASNWAWLQSVVKPKMEVLNLFGYTGGATLACASAGADVVHVDASKPVVTWGRENSELSGLQDKKIRWIEDDAIKFAAREIRRERKYDGIILDPPAFGRGPTGEIWKFDEHLPGLLADCSKLLKKNGFILVNAYSLGYPALAVENLVRSQFPMVKKLESVELTLKESGKRGYLLPAGVAVRGSW